MITADKAKEILKKEFPNFPAYSIIEYDNMFTFTNSNIGGCGIVVIEKQTGKANIVSALDSIFNNKEAIKHSIL